MKRILKAGLIAGIAALALAGCAKKAADKADAAATQVPTEKAAMTPALTYQYRQLANGLRVYAMPDPNTANVSVQVWYDVGSKDDPKGRSGFAHLFEHIMFKSTRNMPSEFFDRLTEDVGGFNNASTADDYTNYYEVVPANHLERILWAESERMGSLVVDDGVFDSERDVVKEELRQRILASPYGRLFGLYLAQANFDVHPYGRPGIGSIEDLDAATADDVRAFHATYYRPDNAVLVVAGNFDTAQFDAWVDRYFGPIAKPDRPIPRVTAREPERTAAKSLTTYAPNVPLPAVTISYPGFVATDPDLAALMVLDAVLSRGESSRLYQSLVYTQQVAAEAFTYWEPSRDPGFFAFGAILSEGKSPDEGLAALRGEIARVREADVTAAELAEAKNELLTEKFEARETAFGRAFEVADSVIRYGDPAYSNDLLAKIDGVTAADLKRVAGRLFQDEKSVTIRYLNEVAGAAGDKIATSALIAAADLGIATNDVKVLTLAGEADRIAPPSPAAPVNARIPDTEEQTLANGLEVIVATKRGVPLVSANLRFSSGFLADPAGQSGVADLTAALVTKGTATRSATQIAQAIESLGADLSAGADSQSSSVSLMTRVDRASEAFAIMADVVRNPQFAEEELDRARQQELDGLSVAMSEPGQAAARVMRRILLGEAPPTEKSYAAITRGGVADYHRQHWKPRAGVLVIAGDIAAKDGFALAQKAFGDWNYEEVAYRSIDETPPPYAPRTVVVDMPGAGQAAVLFGVRGPARTSADYFPAAVAIDILGGGYSARLNAEIRIKRGLSYGASASLSARAHEAPIVARAQTRNDAAAEVARLMAGELKRLGSEPIAPQELGARKAVMIGDFGRDVETTGGIAGQISSLALFGLPPSALASYTSDIAGVSVEAVRTVAAARLNPAKASIVIVGDASKFYPAFVKDHPSAERIAIDKLNLDKPELK